MSPTLPPAWQLALIALAAGVAVGLRYSPRWKGYQFTAWILTVVIAAMFWPQRFLAVGGFDLRTPWLFLTMVQLVMFGMGTQMGWHDFAELIKSPRGVLVGVVGRFTVMPLAGYALIHVFHFEPEIAAGVILIGSCSSGLASNVMAYLAGANLALSVAITALTTVAAVVLTPLWMHLLAGTLVSVDPLKMMVEIARLVLVPIGAALLHDHLKQTSPRGRRVVHLAAMISGAVLAAVLSSGASGLAANLFAYLLGAVVFGTLYHEVAARLSGLDRRMPVLAMAGIVYFTAVTTAAGRDHLLHVGGLLFLVAALHNLLGYVLGYWLGRAAGLDRNSARSLAFETGIQNGGMASGIAGAAGHLGTMGLAAAIFSPWMNISGSVLANYWHRQPVLSPNTTTQTKAPSKI
jgi:BASS family bile acid:Na+ symporter